MRVAAVVGDANLLVSAVIGGAALRVFCEYGIPVHVARLNVDEVAEYLPAMAEKYGLSAEAVELQWRLLPKIVQPMSRYRRQLARARRDLAARDPDDAHPLALARAMRLPLWSNDHDLEGHGVVCYPTARLLKAMERQRGDVP